MMLDELPPISAAAAQRAHELTVRELAPIVLGRVSDAMLDELCARESKLVAQQWADWLDRFDRLSVLLDEVWPSQQRARGRHAR
jgi:hypothetical protein